MGEVDGTKVTILAVLGLLVGLIFLALKSWILMLLLGAAAHVFGVSALALSFWQTFFGLWVLAVIASAFKSHVTVAK